MNPIIKYQNWPEFVKVITALSNKRFTVKSPTIPMVLGYLLLLGGLFDLIYNFSQNNISELSDFLDPLGYTIIGALNIASGNAIKWINKNSSWEERFENSSTTFHKVLAVLFVAIALVGAYFAIGY